MSDKDEYKSKKEKFLRLSIVIAMIILVGCIMYFYIAKFPIKKIIIYSIIAYIVSLFLGMFITAFIFNFKRKINTLTNGIIYASNIEPLKNGTTVELQYEDGRLFIESFEGHIDVISDYDKAELSRYYCSELNENIFPLKDQSKLFQKILNKKQSLSEEALNQYIAIQIKWNYESTNQYILIGFIPFIDEKFNQYAQNFFIWWKELRNFKNIKDEINSTSPSLASVEKEAGARKEDPR